MGDAELEYSDGVKYLQSYPGLRTTGGKCPNVSSWQEGV